MINFDASTFKLPFSNKVTFAVSSSLASGGVNEPIKL